MSLKISIVLYLLFVALTSHNFLLTAVHVTSLLSGMLIGFYVGRYK